MFRPVSFNWVLYAVGLGIGWMAHAASPALGQSEDGRSGQAKSNDMLPVVVGFDGTWKLGHTCPIRVDIPDELTGKAHRLEVRTIDGDGVGLTYFTELTGALDATPAADSSQRVVWMSVRMGRRSSELRVRLLGKDYQTLAQTQVPIEETQALDSDQHLILALGSAMGVQELSRSNADGSGSSFTTLVANSAASLPVHWRDYDSCDVLVVSTLNSEFLATLSAVQWTAMDTWIRRGGGCIVALQTENLDFLSDSDAKQVFQSWIPGTIEGLGRVADPGSLESLISTEEPLGKLSVTRLADPRGQVELSFSDTLNREVPWWISSAHGQGTIRVVASDLGDPAFAEWSDRNALWSKLLGHYFDASMLERNRRQQRSNSRTSYLGYGDLVGQLRATLDVFNFVREVSFGQITAMLVAVLVLIGPVDYWISVRWLKRPDLSWWVAGSTLVLISAGLLWLYSAVRPDQVRINTAQVIDIDAQSGQVSGRLWTHIYSGQAHRVDVTSRTTEANSGVAVTGDPVPPLSNGTHPAMEVTSCALDWQGLPGKGLGGLQSQFNSEQGIPEYRLELDQRGQSRVQGVSIPAAGTKCFAADWIGQAELSGQSWLTEIPGVDQLEGDLVNPLNVDIKDAMLFYHNWFYRLNSRLPPGSKTRISFETIPKDLARRLNRRRTVDGSDSVTRWDPADRHALDRLLELMMFHKAAAGRTYTSLAHRYQPHMDHSNLLDTDNAILVGRIDVPPVSIDVQLADAAEVQVEQDINRTWCRLTIPVQTEAE